jgi:hypothetical protein
MEHLEKVLLIIKVILVAIILVIIGTVVDFRITEWFSNKSYKTIDSKEIESNESTNFLPEAELLAKEPGIELINKHCLGCHSSRLIIQNRLSEESWRQNITWMQATQGLWNLGADHEAVIAYLTKNYGPVEVGRRANLDQATIQWYPLEN